MDLSHMWVCPPTSYYVLRLFFFFWPLVSIAFIARRGRSSAPLTAMLLPLSVALCGTWLGFYNGLQGMAISGSGGWAAVAAGFADALSVLFMGGLSVLAVGVVTLIRRHRPVADHVTVLLSLLFAADLIAAVLFARFLTFEIANLVFVGMGVSAVIAAAVVAWFFVIARDCVAPAPLPSLAPALAIAIAALLFVVWYHAHSYRTIAMQG